MTSIGGRYELEERLGKGASGSAVFQALDTRIKRRVAIKLMRLPVERDQAYDETIARFRREAEAAGALPQHPNVVGVHDYGEDRQHAWLVMELVTGTSLLRLLNDRSRLSLPQVIRIMSQVLAGLGWSHQHGVVHRDIKPGNIMLTSNGVVKITDFGVARIESSTMTRVGTLIGTPAYMSPEQFHGTPADARSDIWASGVLLYELLTGEKPFDGSTETVVMHQVLTVDPSPPSARFVEVPRTFDRVIARALSKRPEDRYASAAEFWEAIRVAASVRPEAGFGAAGHAVPGAGKRPTDSSPQIESNSTPPRRRVEVSARLAGLVMALVAAGLGAVYLLSGTLMPSAAQRPDPGVPVPAVVATSRSPAELRAIAASAAAIAPCSLIAWSADDRRLTLSGIASRDGEERVRRAIRDAGAEGQARLELTAFNGPYCPLLERIRPVVLPPDQAPGLALSVPSPLVHGQLLVFDVDIPDWAEHLAVAYATSSGDVATLIGSRAINPGRRIRFGQPQAGFAGWEVDEPFGSDLLLAIVSDRPIFPRPRSGNEFVVQPIAQYVAVLGTAIQQAEAAGGRVAIRALIVPTTPAP